MFPETQKPKILVHIHAVDKNYRQRSSVTIQPMSVQLNLVAEYQLAQVLLGSLAKKLVISPARRSS